MWEDLHKALYLPTPLQRSAYLSSVGCEVFVKRDDLIHPHICGNKYRKLKYNLLKAIDQNAELLVTYGGQFSNHLVAVAAAGKLLNIKTLGFVRGYLLDEENPSIRLLRSYDMEIVLVRPDDYRRKEHSPTISSLLSQYDDYYVIPEGGTNELALKGVAEGIMEVEDLASYDYIVLGLGTGGTIAGVCRSVVDIGIKVIGVSPFKSDQGDYHGLVYLDSIHRSCLEIVSSSLRVKFGGYHPSILKVMEDMESVDDIRIDPIYMAKTVFTIKQLLAEGYFPEGSKILLLHTGGLQGVAGYNYLYAKKINTRH